MLTQVLCKTEKECGLGLGAKHINPHFKKREQQVLYNIPLTADEKNVFSVIQNNRLRCNMFLNGNNNTSIFKNRLSQNILMSVQVESLMVWHIHKQ